MSLLLATTRDHALLTLIVREAQRVATDKDTFVGRTALQKIVYFLKVSGVPMGYSFQIHHFGPFCSDILMDTDTLLADGVLVDLSSRRQEYSNYSTTAEAEELMKRFRDDLETTRPLVQAVVAALVPLRPDELELIATLDYFYRWYKAAGALPPFKDKVVDKFVESKGDKFPRDKIALVYDVLVRAGLFGA